MGKIGVAREGRLGLVSAAERALAIGGKLQISTVPGQETRLRVIMDYCIVQTQR